MAFPGCRAGSFKVANGTLCFPASAASMSSKDPVLGLEETVFLAPCMSWTGRAMHARFHRRCQDFDELESMDSSEEGTSLTNSATHSVWTLSMPRLRGCMVA